MKRADASIRDLGGAVESRDPNRSMHPREDDAVSPAARADLATLDRLRAQIEHAEANEHEWLANLARRKLREAASAPLMKNTKARLW
jgi:hypothetical protein